MKEYTIVGYTDDEERVNMTFTIPDDIPGDNNMVHLYAVRCLWENRWTPGSLCWRVVGTDVGETTA